MNKNDLKQTAEVVKVEIAKNNGVLEMRIDSKMSEQLQRLEGKMFEWKSEIMNAVDSLAMEIHNEQEFREITTGQIVESRERIEKLEKKVFGGVTAA